MRFVLDLGECDYIEKDDDMKEVDDGNDDDILNGLNHCCILHMKMK